MKLHLYIFRELATAFCFTFGGILVLTLPAVAVATISKLPIFDARIVVTYLPMVLIGVVPYVLPLAFLLAVISGFGRFAADNEWTAIRMSGRHPLTCFAPGFVLALALGAITLWLVAEVVPSVHRRQNLYVAEAMAIAMRDPNPGGTDLSIGGYYVSARRRDGRAFVDAQIHLPAKGKEPARNVRADRLDFRFDQHNVYLIMKNARSVVDATDVQNGDLTVRIDLETDPENPDGFHAMRYLTSREIKTEIENEHPNPARERDLRFELHYRFALSSVCVVFLLLGAPTALMLRRGTQLPALAAGVGYALLFYLLQMRLARQIGASGILPPELSAWIAIAIGAAAGIWLVRKVVRQ